MILTLVKNEWFLSSPNERAIEYFKKRKDVWIQNTKDQYFTKDLRAALKFKIFADERTAKIIDSLFVKHYENHWNTNVWNLPTFLDKHQQDGVKWVLERSRSYLAHAPGAGKTLECITIALFNMTEGQNLFIVPPTLTTTWDREIIKWVYKVESDYLESSVRTHGKDYFYSIAIVPQSDKMDLMDWEADFIICPDSMITNEFVHKKLLERDFSFIAVDEASRFKDSTAQRTGALFGNQNYKSLIKKAKHVVLLDGSPMPNRPMELWAPVYAMAPEAIDFMSQSDFGFRYCAPTQTDQGQYEFKGAHNQEELKEKLQKDFMHVVTEKDLNHPERLRSMIFMTEDPRSTEQKTWELKHLDAKLLTNISEKLNKGQAARYRRELGIKKVPWIARYLREQAEKNESILIFAWHVEVCTQLGIQLKKYGPKVIIGETPMNIRDKYFDMFQEKKINFLIGNIQAIGRGQNLQRADQIVFGEYSWSDQLNIQCEKRGSRKGSDRLSLPCKYIVCPDSMDETILKAVFRKAKNFKRIIG